MTRLRRILRASWVASLMLGISVFVLIAGGREFGLLQPAEFLGVR